MHSGQRATLGDCKGLSGNTLSALQALVVRRVLPGGIVSGFSTRIADLGEARKDREKASETAAKVSVQRRPPASTDRAGVVVVVVGSEQANDAHLLLFLSWGCSAWLCSALLRSISPIHPVP